jgi:D-3-phosphoglycerate dehydrogenase
MPYRCAILDDYQDAARKSADWSPIAKEVEIKVFNAPLGGPDKVIQALADFDIVVGIRERTPFPRAVIAALPKLKLLITTGARNASFDVEAAREHNVVVCGTPGAGNPTAGIAIGLMLELTRHIGYENARMVSGFPTSPRRSA